VTSTSIKTLAFTSLTETPKTRLQNILATFPQPQDTPRKTSLLPLQWHLNSTPRRGRFLPRNDVRATEAWKKRALHNCGMILFSLFTIKLNSS